MNAQLATRFSVLVYAVLLAATSAAREEALLAAPEDAPRYRLSNFRLEDNRFGRPELVFDYTRTRSGKGFVQVAGRTASGPLEVTFAPIGGQESGEVRLSKMHSFGGGTYDYQFYLVMPANWAGKNYGNCLVSNTVRMGNPGSGVRARPMNAEEQAAYEKNKLANTPPGQAPAGFQLVSSPRRLVPGMPILAGRYADWIDAEYLGLAPDNEVSVLFRGDEKASTVPDQDWVAVDPSVLSSNSDRYKPSMRILPGGKAALPRDAEAIDPDLELTRGVPLLLYRGFEWQKVLVLDDRGPTIRVRYAESSGKFDRDHKRAELAIRRSTLEKLASGGGDSYADDMVPDEVYDEDELYVSESGQEWDVALQGEYTVFDKNYPINIRIPRGAQLVPDDIELPVGVPLAYCWARRWNACHVVADRDQKLIVREVDDITDFAFRIDRGQLIIQDKSLRKLKRNSAKQLADLKQTLRTWTDSSGQHKVEARFVSVDETKVTLKTDAGREISLPLKRLSDEDRELVEGLTPETDNPFE